LDSAAAKNGLTGERWALFISCIFFKPVADASLGANQLGNAGANPITSVIRGTARYDFD